MLPGLYTYVAAALVAAALAGTGAWKVQGWRYDAQLGQLRTQLDDVRADARACSDATEDLRTLADKRKTEADKARSAATDKAKTHEQRADYTLGLRPKHPADMCASMQALGDEWLQGRTKP